MGRASDPMERKHEKEYEASQRAAARVMQRLARKVEQLSSFVEDPKDGQPYITSINFKMNSGWDGGVLAIVKGVSDGDDVVGFHSEEAFDECLVGLANRLANGSLKWREDTPYASGSGDNGSG